MLYMDLQLVAGDYETITVSSVVKSLTASKIIPTSGTYLGYAAFRAMLSVVTDDIWYTLHGVDASGTVGHKLLTTDAPIIIVGTVNLQNFRALRVTNDASLRVTYFYNKGGR